LVTLGDYWLAQAIEQGLIQPLDPANAAVAFCQSLARTGKAQRTFGPSRKSLGGSYRWGTTSLLITATNSSLWIGHPAIGDLWRAITLAHFFT